MMLSFRCFACTALLAFVAGGCGPSDDGGSPKKKAKKPADKPLKVERIDATELPQLGDPFPVEGEPIDVARPPSWTRDKPSTEARPYGLWVYRPPGGKQFPRINLDAEDFSGLDRVTSDNVLKFAEAVVADLKVNNRKPVGPIRGALIGDFAGVEYQLRGKLPSGQVLDRMFLVTVAHGRKYTLELQAIAGSVSRKPQGLMAYLYAMAGGIDFAPERM